MIGLTPGGQFTNAPEWSLTVHPAMIAPFKRPVIHEEPAPILPHAFDHRVATGADGDAVAVPVMHAERLGNVILARACLGADRDHIRLNDRRTAGRTTDARARYDADVQATDQLSVHEARAEGDVPLQRD